MTFNDAIYWTPGLRAFKTKKVLDEALALNLIVMKKDKVTGEVTQISGLSRPGFSKKEAN